MDIAVDIIEPCGFPFSARSLKRAGMDYFEHAEFTRHSNWDAFCASFDSNFARLILLTSKSKQPFHRFCFEENDILLFGSESSGVPLSIHDRADARIAIPMRPGMRSLNLAVSAGMALGEALRQTGRFPT